MTKCYTEAVSPLAAGALAAKFVDRIPEKELTSVVTVSRGSSVGRAGD